MRIRIDAYPQLRQLGWNRPNDTVLEGEEALALYERNWRFIHADDLTEEDERAMIDQLVLRHGDGVLLAA